MAKAVPWRGAGAGGGQSTPLPTPVSSPLPRQWRGSGERCWREMDGQGLQPAAFGADTFCSFLPPRPPSDLHRPAWPLHRVGEGAETSQYHQGMSSPAGLLSPHPQCIPRGTWSGQRKGSHGMALGKMGHGPGLAPSPGRLPCPSLLGEAGHSVSLTRNPVVCEMAPQHFLQPLAGNEVMFTGRLTPWLARGMLS